MNTTLTTTVLFGTLLLGLSAGTARAEEVARVTVPFPFDVNGHTLPAGRYDVRIDDQNPAIVRSTGRRTTSRTRWWGPRFRTMDGAWRQPDADVRQKGKPVSADDNLGEP